METISSVSINIEEQKEGNSTDKQSSWEVENDNLVKRAAQLSDLSCSTYQLSLGTQERF